MILNSTPGKIGMLHVRNRRSEIYPNFHISNLLRIPLPRIADLSVSQVKGLAYEYDHLCHREKLSLRDAHLCPVQKAIDDSVCMYLGFDRNTCIKARWLLSQEPMVSGKRYQEDWRQMQREMNEQ